MTAILKLILFFLSSFGWGEMLRRNGKFHVSFLPSTVIAVQSFLLFLAGLTNLLSEAVWLLYGIGFLFLGISLWKERSVRFLKNYANTGYVFLAIVSVIILIFLKGKLFTSYDNFSHWALVVKNMLVTDRFPNFEDSLITFSEYPLGSSVYIYFFSKLVSTSESIQMFAQFYMIISCILPLYAFVKRNRIAGFAAILCFTNLILVYNITITNLLVDTLLPVFSICALLYTHLYFRDSEHTSDIFLIALYMIQIVQIKNSGIFFLLPILLYLVLGRKKNLGISSRILCIAAPFFSIILWQKHCSYVFTDAGSSKHAMTTENYSSIFGSKTPEDIRSICSSMFTFSVTWKDVWLTLLLLITIGILILLFARRQRKAFYRFFIASLVLYLLYQLGSLGMYLFSMPGEEATSLASVERYTKTILTAILYLSMVPALKLISSCKTRAKSSWIAFMICCVLTIHLVASTGSLKTVIQYSEDPAVRNWIETAKTEYQVAEDKSYCILAPENIRGYCYYLTRFMFLSDNVSALSISKKEDLNLISSDYIFVYDQENEIINEWIKEKFPAQYGKKVIMREKN